RDRTSPQASEASSILTLTAKDQHSGRNQFHYRSLSVHSHARASNVKGAHPPSGLSSARRSFSALSGRPRSSRRSAFNATAARRGLVKTSGKVSARDR